MEWISVKDKLPKDFKDFQEICEHDAVLVISISVSAKSPIPLYGIARWHDYGWEVMENSGSHSCTGFYALDPEDITHWMPLPDRPDDLK